MAKGYFVDLSIAPEIYRTDIPKYYGKLAIDFFPEDNPTVAPFDSLQEVKDYLIRLFGEEQYRTWFPGGICTNASCDPDYVEGVIELID